MGHLFSRALRRLTQCSQSRNELAQQGRTMHSQQPVEQQDKNHDARSQATQLVSQSIAVGQSIDSDEYADLCPPQSVQQRSDDNHIETATSSIAAPPATTAPGSNQPDVEEAVIKIQALVRGHLTRKALKDAHQQSNPNALGQSQFDEESLIRNPPTAVFLSSTPLSLDNYQQSTACKTIEHRERTPLESISEAEADEAMAIHQQDDGAQIDHDQPETHNKDDYNKDGGLSASPSNLEMPQRQKKSLSVRESVSPVPSEANVSLDINCDTPASASIDILDFNIKPTDQMASVLHHRVEPDVKIVGAPSSRDMDTGEGFSGQQNELVNTPDSLLDSEEAAAIRIQSAFRGYRTRKNSPYRTRSPNLNILPSMSNGDNEQARVGQSLQVESELPMTPEEQLEANTCAIVEGRRSSRSRRRIPSSEAVDLTESVSIDDHEVARTASNNIASTDDTCPIRELLNHQALEQQGAIVDEEDQLIEQANSLLGDTNVSESQSAALEAESTTTDSNEANDNGSLPLSHHMAQTGSSQPQQQRQQQLKRKSDTSAETDSSILGAALSMNDEISELAHESQSAVTSVALEPIEESADASGSNKSNNETLIESEARQLVEEMSNATENEDCCVLEATTDADTTTGLPVSIIDDEQQRTIELESDDIERRDPRGHASEERSSSKSPQIRTEEPQFSVVDVLSPSGKIDSKKLTADLENPSGCISSAASSAGLSTSNENSDDSDDGDSKGDNSDQEATIKQGAISSTGKGQQTKKPTQQQQQQSKGKSKRNRNKRKGKK